jgi:hypothetical protein
VITRPCPGVRLLHQAARHGVAVHIGQLLHALSFGVDIEVVIPLLPEGPFAAMERYRKLDGLERLGQGSVAGFAEEKVDVFGHDDVAVEDEAVSAAHEFKGACKGVPRGVCVQIGPARVAGECHEVQIAGLLVAHQVLRHVA